jgi:hypothetical protein
LSLQQKGLYRKEWRCPSIILIRIWLDLQNPVENVPVPHVLWLILTPPLFVVLQRVKSHVFRKRGGKRNGG